MSDKGIILLIFGLYLLLMVGIGFIFYRKSMSSSTYMLGGRSLNPWVTAFSAQASDMSGWLLTGLPGLCCLGIAAGSVAGIKESIFTAIGLFIGTAANWIFVAKRLRVYTEVASNSITVPSFFANRFDDKKGILQAISGVVILFFFTFYAASMFSAGAKMFETIFGLDYHLALLIGASIIVLYTLLGGFLAVSWTDLIQGLIMFFALIIVPIFVMRGFSDADFSAMGEIGNAISNLLPQQGEAFTWITIATALSWGLGYFGMPHVLVRFMATKNKKTIKPAAIIALVWVAITMACAILIGIVGRVAVGDGLTDATSETVFMQLVMNSFGPIVAGLLLSAILAAIMSTADSQLLVASSSFAEDIYKKHLRKNATDKEVLFVSRMTIIAVSAVAILLALDPESKIFELVKYAWGGFGASFGPLVIFSLYSKKIKFSGAVASIVTGAVTTIVWRYGLSHLGGIFLIYELIPGFILSSAALWIGSLCDKRPISDKMATDYDNFKIALKDKSDDNKIEDDQNSDCDVESDNEQMMSADINANN